MSERKPRTKTVKAAFARTSGAKTRRAKAEIIAAFTEDHVSALTGISKRQLQYWDEEGFFVPSLAYEDRSCAYSRLYSFRDLVSLKVLNRLRNECQVPLQHLRQVRDKLLHLGEDLWSKTTLYVLNKKVVFVNPKTGKHEEVVSRQGVLDIPLNVETDDMKAAVERLRKREPSSIGQFEQKRNRANNQVVIAGTRIPVRSVKAFHAAGYSVEQIRQEYPSLTDEDIRAAIGHRSAA